MQRYLTIIAFAGVITSCSKEPPKQDPEPRPVITHLVQPPQAETIRTFTGVSEATGSAELGFEISGRIIEMQAISGKRYTKGAVLAKLDTGSYQSQLVQAKAESTRATEELKRVQQLFETGNASKAQLDQAIAAQKSGAAALVSAQRNVSNGTLLMPYDGVIAEVLKDQQEVVSAGTPVIQIQGEGSMEFEIGVTADYIDGVKAGMKATVSFPSISTRPLAATIVKISPQPADNTTYPVTLSIDEKNDKLRDGLDGEASIPLPNPKGSVIRVPISCVVGASGGQKHVFIIEKKEGAGGMLGTIVKRPVTTGSLSDHATVEILAGLQAGEIILARGVHRIEVGTEVRITE